MKNTEWNPLYEAFSEVIHTKWWKWLTFKFYLELELKYHSFQFFIRSTVSWPRTWSASRTYSVAAGRTTSKGKSSRPTATASGRSSTHRRFSTTGQGKFSKGILEYQVNKKKSLQWQYCIFYETSIDGRWSFLTSCQYLLILGIGDV